MRKLVISLAVLLVLLVAADRVAAAVAQNKISDRVAASYQLPAKPAVTIRGFPFLTQLLSGNYREIDVRVPRVSVGSIRLTQLHARLLGIHASLGQLLHGGSTVTAARATGSAVIPYGELAGWLPHGVTLSRAGRQVRLSGNIQVLGVRVPVSATAVPSLTATGIKVTPTSFHIPSGAGLPASAASLSATAVTGRLGLVIPLTDLPLHMRVGSVAVTAGGLRAGASASNVEFTGSP